MRILGPSGDYLELEIAGYEFPEPWPDMEGYEPNWLQVRLKVSARGHTWELTDPCLLTWELRRLADWIELLAAEHPDPIAMEFTEPGLHFEVLGTSAERAQLRIYFEMGCRPESLPYEHYPARDLWADLELRAEDLQAWAADLRGQLEKYPLRGDVAGFVS